MKRFLSEKKLMIAGITGALLVLCCIAGVMFIGPMVVSAAPVQTTPTTTANKGNTYCNLYQQNLAKSLNVSTGTLNQDRKTAAINAINQLVKEGKLKQARATKIEQRINKSNANSCGFLNIVRTRNAWFVKIRAQVIAQVAQGLHLTNSQLIAQLKAGKSLQDVANTQHVSASSLQIIVTNALTNALKQAVSKKQLTQKRATAITTFIQKHPKFVQNLMNRHFKQATNTTSK